MYESAFDLENCFGELFSMMCLTDFVRTIIMQLDLKKICQERFNREDELISALWNEECVRDEASAWLKAQFKSKEFPNKLEGKSSVQSKRFKEMGNEKFQMKKYPESIELYTKSALYAPADSDELSIAIANRSAALFYLGRYQDCLKDIDSAIALGYPLPMRYKLYLRAAQCYIKLKDAKLATKSIDEAQDNIKDSQEMTPSAKANLEKRIAELKSLVTVINNNDNHCINKTEKAKPCVAYGESTEIPSASAAIKRRYSVEKGRHLVANRLIKKNEILFVEKAVAPTFVDNKAHSVCEKCYEDYNDHPIPCTTCMNAFYCDVNCMKEAWSSYHRWECPGNQFDMWQEPRLIHSTLRMLLTSATTLKSAEFNEIHQLITNYEKVSHPGLMTYGVITVVLTTYLRDHTDFFDAIDIEQALVKKYSGPNPAFRWDTSTDYNKEIYVSCLMLRYTLQMKSNAITVEDGKVEPITAIFPSASMLNHSCDPNTISSFQDGYIVIKAARRIARGEEICVTYGPHYTTTPTKDRQKYLEMLYHFKCKCSACTSKLY